MEVNQHQEKNLQYHHIQEQKKNQKSPRPKVKGTFSTSYADTYKDITYAPTSPPRPQYKYQQRHYSPDIMKSSYQVNFHDQPVNYVNPETPSKLQNAGSKIVGKVPFLGSSSYKDQFKGFVVIPPVIEQYERKQIKAQSTPPQIPRSPVKFQGVTSYKSQFVQPKVQSKPPQPATYKKLNIPFQGQSSYKNQFPRYKFEPVPTKPQQYMISPRKPTVKFEGKSSYHDQFKGFGIQSPRKQTISPPMNYINQKDHDSLKKFV